MSSIEQLNERLRNVSMRADKNARNLARERQYLTETMEKVQKNFGGQREGQQLVVTLMSIINHLAAADSALNELRTEINLYVSNSVK